MRVHVDEKTLKSVRDRFDAYVEGFQEVRARHQRNISLKREHSLRVCEECLRLSEALGLPEEERRLAQVIGLIHDIGRFEQYARYRTFLDRQSIDHGDLGARVIRECGILEDWEEATRDLVLRSVRYHNKAALPEDETETCLFFSRLIRDADKLDIWNVVIGYYLRSDGERNGVIELGLPDTPAVSEAVCRHLMDEKIVRMDDLKTLNDFKLLQVSWIYDLNFIPAIQRAVEKDYLTIIRRTLPRTHQIDDIFEVAASYIKTRIGVDAA